jgi:MFS transporter, DHA1 family, multidrug resistance protein
VKRAAPGGREFLAIVALCMGMGAVSIDLLLPAFPEMRADLGLAAGATSISEVITAFFLGIAVGQLFFGPLSDRYGRRPMLQAGLVVFVLGAAAAAVSTSLSALVLCRFVWGFGSAAPRSLALAMVRDSFEGDRMARMMSLLMAIFVVIPVVAPSVGTAILEVASWRTIVWVQAAVGVALAIWSMRLPETIRPDDRRTISPRALATAARVVLTTRTTLALAVAVSALFGVMTGFIGTAEVMIDEVFGRADQFALVFGFIASMLAVGSLISARLVTRVGLPSILKGGAVYLVAVATLFTAIVLSNDGRPPLWAFVAGMSLLLPGLTLLIPNSNTAAMAPLGHVAGMGAAVLGTVSTAGGALLGSLVDSAYDGTITPYAMHVFVFAVVAAGLIVFAGRVREPDVEPAMVEPLPAT